MKRSVWRRVSATLAAAVGLVVGLACSPEPPPLAPQAPGAAGSAQAAASQYTDSDTNDSVGPSPVSNDSLVDAQPIPVPAVVGGYVAVQGEGEVGAVSSLGDLVDLYLADLKDGHVVTLLASEDSSIANVDLALYDDGGTFLTSSATNSDVESLTITADGKYYIEVRIRNLIGTSDASSYVLAVGPVTTTLGALRDLDPSGDFVPGEIVVRMRASGLQTLAKSSSPATRMDVGEQLSLDALSGEPDRAMLFALGDRDERAAALQKLGAMHSAASAQTYAAASDEDQLRLDTVLAVQALRNRPDVETADLNWIRRPSFDPDDPHYPLQWHYPLINLPLAWDLTATPGLGITVAVIDTGILPHPDLMGQYAGGFDFIRDPVNAADNQSSVPGEGDIDGDPTDAGDGDPANGFPHSFHGTHVAGTIAAATDNALGVAGVAGAASVMPLRVCGSEGCTSYDIEQAILFAAGLPNDSGTLPAQRADVINMSLGGPGASASVQQVVDAARAQGLIIVAAAGNEATSDLQYPASYTGVISVSAVDLNLDLAPYSSFGGRVDVAAPGGDTSTNLNGDPYVDGVLSTLADAGPRYNYVFYQGTSMATPHMSGVAALMLSEWPAMLPGDLDGLLAAGSITVDLGVAGRDDDFGNGLIDAHLAVQTAITNAGGGGGGVPARLVVTPTSLNFPVRTTTRRLTVSRGGSGPLTVTGPNSTSEPWLSVAADSVDGDGLGSYVVSIVSGEFAMLPDGTHSALVTLVSSSNTVNLTVLATKGGEQYPNTGYQFFLLLNPDTFETVDFQSVGISRGRYRFRFDDVPPGEYLIVGGTDNDNDGFICDTGEACGAYPQLDAPERIDIDSFESGLDFTTGYLLEVRTLGAGDEAARPRSGYRIAPGTAAIDKRVMP